MAKKSKRDPVTIFGARTINMDDLIEALQNAQRMLMAQGKAHATVLFNAKVQLVEHADGSLTLHTHARN